MWVSSLRLRVKTKARAGAGTDNVVTVEVLRDGQRVANLKLDHRGQDDLEPGATQDFDYTGPTALPRTPDDPQHRPPGAREGPPPPHGIEFGRGLKGHIGLRATIHGTDAWTKDDIELHVKEIRQKPDINGRLSWSEDAAWTRVAHWTQDATLTGDSQRGPATWTMAFR